MDRRNQAYTDAPRTAGSRKACVISIEYDEPNINTLSGFSAWIDGETSVFPTLAEAQAHADKLGVEKLYSSSFDHYVQDAKRAGRGGLLT